MTRISTHPAPEAIEGFLESLGQLAERESRSIESLLDEALDRLRQSRAAQAAIDGMRPDLAEMFREHLRDFGGVHRALAAYDKTPIER